MHYYKCCENAAAVIFNRTRAQDKDLPLIIRTETPKANIFERKNGVCAHGCVRSNITLSGNPPLTCQYLHVTSINDKLNKFAIVYVVIACTYTKKHML